MAVVKIQESQVEVMDYQDVPPESSAACEQCNSESTLNLYPDQYHCIKSGISSGFGEKEMWDLV